MTEIINKKVEDSLKIVTQKLKDKLLIELDKYFPISQNNSNNKIPQVKKNYSSVNQNYNNGNNLQYDEDFNFMNIKIF